MWSRCLFQSIRNDPIDQLLFMLFGGQLMHPLLDKCDVWSSESCPCIAHKDMFGKTFVEIGANDGLHMSNSHFFETFLGWRGICIEANPHVYKRLVKNRPRCYNVNGLVGEPTQRLTAPFISFFRRGNEEKYNTARDWETGLSGIEGAGHKEIASEKSAKRFARSAGLQYSRTMLPILRFSDIFARANVSDISFLSLDVEGAEEGVLRSIDFEKVLIRVIVIETVNENITRLLKSSGYRNLNVRLPIGDQIFVHKKGLY